MITIEVYFYLVYFLTNRKLYTFLKKKIPTFTKLSQLFFKVLKMFFKEIFFKRCCKNQEIRCAMTEQIVFTQYLF